MKFIVTFRKSDETELVEVEAHGWTDARDRASCLRRDQGKPSEPVSTLQLNHDYHAIRHAALIAKA